MVPMMLLVSALTFPLAFFLPIFVEKRQGLLDNGTKSGEGFYLKPYLSWFQTPDNSLDGDEGWRVEHWQWRFKLPSALATYVGRIGWLWRNPAYGFGYVYLTGSPLTAIYSGNRNVNDSPGVEGWCLVQSNGLFQFVYVKRIAENKSIYCNFGWNIKGLIDGTQTTHFATFAFSPRLSKFEVR